MEKVEKCPVCGKENVRKYYTECVGTVEDYYFCAECGYFRYMAYSPVIEGYCIPKSLTPKEHEALYGKKVKELNLSFFRDEEIP